MSDSIEQATKIKLWLEKTSLTYALSPHPSRIRKEMKAAQIEPDAAIPIVIDLLATETDPYFLPKVIWLAGALKAEAAIPQLVEILKNVENSQVHEAAVKTLTILNSNDPVHLAIRSLKDERAAVRDRAVLSLQKLKAKSSVPYLLELLGQEQDQMVLWRAQIALAELDAREVIPAFIQMIKERDNAKISVALKMLGQLKAKEAIPLIIEFIRNSKVYSKEISEAVHVLVALGSRDEIPEFISWLKAENSQQRYFGIIILRLLKAKEAAPSMLDLIKDVDSGVRFKAIKTLGEWQIREAIPQIIEALEDTNREVLSQVVYALRIMNATEAVPNLLNRLYHFPYAKFNGLPQFDYLYQELVLALEYLGDEAVREQIKTEIATVKAALEIERERREAQARGDYF